jgi:hypothetical protein
MTPPRIYCVPAREAPVVAVFRRGPSAWAHVGKWDLAQGSYEPGAWLRGRLFPRRSDVSPDGRHLCYLAHDPRATREHGDAYIGVSRLPWLTALHAIGSCGTHTRGYHFAAPDGDPEEGDPEGGGPEESGSEGGGTEGGDPTGSARLPIAWRLAATSVVQFATERRLGWHEAPDSPPRVDGDFWDERRNARMRKPRPDGEGVLHLGSHGAAGGEFGVAQSVDGMRVTYALERGGQVEPLPDVQWADWDARGRLLVATRQGALQVRGEGGAVLEEHDLASLRPDPRPPPSWAGEW